MLRKLDIRLKTYTILFIAIFIAFMMLTSYHAFKKILTDNYIEKSIQITKQEAENAAATLKNIEEINNIVISELNLDNPNLYKTHSPDYIRNLSSYNKFYPYFTSFFVYHQGQVLYYHAPTSSYIDDYDTIIKNTKFNQKGVGWFTVANSDRTDDFLLMVRKIPLDNDFIYIFFMIDYSNISNHFNGNNEFANHKEVFLSAGNNLSLCQISTTQSNKKSDNKKLFEELKNPGHMIIDSNTMITRSDIEYGSVSFFCTDNITPVNFYTSVISVIYIAVFVITIILAFLAVSILSKSMSKQLERIRTEMQNYL